MCSLGDDFETCPLVAESPKVRRELVETVLQPFKKSRTEHRINILMGYLKMDLAFFVW
jgi:hypothetical protein